MPVRVGSSEGLGLIFGLVLMPLLRRGAAAPNFYAAKVRFQLDTEFNGFCECGLGRYLDRWAAIELVSRFFKGGH